MSCKHNDIRECLKEDSAHFGEKCIGINCPEWTAIDPKVIQHEGVCEELNALYERKNADYGDSFSHTYAEYGMTVACIRLSDKLERLKRLTKAEAQVADESIRDTLIDLANYAIMTIMEVDNEKDSDIV